MSENSPRTAKAPTQNLPGSKNGGGVVASTTKERHRTGRNKAEKITEAEEALAFFDAIENLDFTSIAKDAGIISTSASEMGLELIRERGESPRSKRTFRISLSKISLSTGVSQAQAEYTFSAKVREAVSLPQEFGLVTEIIAEDVERSGEKIPQDKPSRTNNYLDQRKRIEEDRRRLKEDLELLSLEMESAYGLPEAGKGRRIDVSLTSEGDFDIEVDYEDVPFSVGQLVKRITPAEPLLLGGRKVLWQDPDGKMRIMSTEISKDLAKGAVSSSGAIQETLEQHKVEMFSRLFPRLKNIARGIAHVQSSTPEVHLLAQIISKEMERALDDILAIEKQSGKKGKGQARTNMIGGTTLFYRLQSFGIIDEVGTQLHIDRLREHLEAYLKDPSPENNLIVSLHSISGRFSRANREKTFPRSAEKMRARLQAFGMKETAATTEDTPHWRIVAGSHPDKNGELQPPIYKRLLSSPQPLITEEDAEFLQAIDRAKAEFSEEELLQGPQEGIEALGAFVSTLEAKKNEAEAKAARLEAALDAATAALKTERTRSEVAGKTSEATITQITGERDQLTQEISAVSRERDAAITEKDAAIKKRDMALNENSDLEKRLASEKAVTHEIIGSSNALIDTITRVIEGLSPEQLTPELEQHLRTLVAHIAALEGIEEQQS